MPTRFRNKKHVPFVTRSLHKRRDAVVKLGWKISRQKDGLTFWTDHLLEDPDEPHRIHRWVDVYFLSADRCTFWNAEIITTDLASEDELDGRAFNAAYAQRSPEEIEIEFGLVKAESKKASDALKLQPVTHKN